jgi:LmbE family N-acetylglucosaminyl deacetylase
MPEPDRKVALAFLAHPDDAEFLCGGTLIRLADRGWSIHIATATAGDCGSMDQDAQAIADIRRGEGAAAAATIGGTYHCIGELDGRVAYEKQTIQKTFDLFRRIAPSLVFAHAEKDYHIDHEQTHLLARSASFMHACPNASAESWIDGTAIPWLYYCDPVEGKDPYGQSVTPTTRIDVSRQLDQKVQMLACHASQREWLREHHGIDEYIDSMKRHSAARGSKMGAAHAEAFVQHRGHAYPSDDLLTELFG